MRYQPPTNWIKYDIGAVTSELVDAKAAVYSVKTVPYQRAWVESLQEMELKREVAGTSRIEGADFTEGELDEALKEESEKELFTRSQKQVSAAMRAYRWIATVPDDQPVDTGLILEIHRYIVTGADDDHCPPGEIRGRDQNVLFGSPRHRGAEGGEECARAFNRLAEAVQKDFQGHDPLIQALAAHYHLAALHPFLDGNGRTARALEALMLQRAGLRDTSFIAMSNYYYDEKNAYLRVLNEVWASGYDLTAFLKLGLRGIYLQSQRLLKEIQGHISKALYRDLMHDLFRTTRTPRKRVIAKRQLHILTLLLETDGMTVSKIIERTEGGYRTLKDPRGALIRDLNELFHLKAIGLEQKHGRDLWVFVRLEWPTEITEIQFFEDLKSLPKGKTFSFLR
ncbi:MAG: Fic family protein [Nitrospinota bacterium]|jgi:Fic family protein|nr:Fic family protein [Nitrospinota bacterium]MDP7168646.1 Fic family protein [Nitrospinota bacterium]MDP7370838.1 Fic family protein [Nitrospinota bacterium]MDP7664393.1 Fic family protein [Nitrospinota bacterium]HJP12818.1 Fic family protein [Nitrospinota bacterium]